MTRKELIRRGAAGMAAALLGLSSLLLLKPYVRINTTDSMPKGVYGVMPGRQDFTQGRLAVLCLPADWGAFGHQREYIGFGECPGDVSSMLKPVSAVPGDVLELTADGAWVNGRAVPNTAPLSRDSGGRALMPYPLGSYAVQPGTIWVFSSHDRRSFDSRYFGPIPDSLVIGAAFPLLTF